MGLIKRSSLPVAVLVTLAGVICILVLPGLLRPSGNLFFLRNSNTTGFPDITVAFGAPGDKALVGNWDGM